jgi:biopolymer transport protein ExbD
MLGLMLCLLVTFMMDATPRRGFYTDRYRSPHATPMPAALREDAMRITLTRDGSTYFGNSKTALEDLADQIRERVKTGAPAKIYLVVDTRARYGDVSTLLDEIRRAGIFNVAFLAELPILHK